MDKVNLKRRTWSQQDNSLLEEGVKKFGIKWQQVANYLKTRTPSQCAQRWKRIKRKISKQEKKSVKWTKDESNRLRKYIHEYGENWQLIAEMFENKSSGQVREKYLNGLDPNIQKKPWTGEEDDILYENFLIHGTKWTFIKTKLPTRSLYFFFYIFQERMVKNRFYNNIRYTHLKLKNHYQLINNEINPQEEIQRFRQKVIESLQATQSQHSMDQTDEVANEDLDHYLNLNDDFSKYYIYDI